MSEILTVFGATGNQGGSVIKAVLNHPELSKKYKIRGVTRDVTKPAAKNLQSLGVEPVKADMDDANSLAEVVKGASAVFAVTNFWEKMSKEIEITQGKAIADACKAAGVKHLVWSSLVNVTHVSGGKYTHVVHFDSKAEVEAYIRQLGVPASFFQPGPFNSLVTGNLKNNKNEDGTRLALPMEPTQKIPLFDPIDSGKYVAGMLLADKEVLGKQVAAASGFYTGQELADTWAKVTGQRTEFVTITDEQMKGFLPEGMKDELGETFFFMRDFGYFAPPDPEGSVKEGHKIMLGKPTTFEESITRDEK